MTVKVWITKYALTDGISEHLVPDSAIKGSGLVYPGSPFSSFCGFRIGTDAHFSLDEAIEAAEAARKKKIDSVKKQLAKLERMAFVK